MATEDQRSNRDPTEQRALNSGITITQNRVIRFLFVNKNVQHVVNLLTVAIFFDAIYRDGVGPMDSGANFGQQGFRDHARDVDVDGDGNDDLILHFSTQGTGFDGGESNGELRWERDEMGEHGFSSTDNVTFVGCERRK